MSGDSVRGDGSLLTSNPSNASDTSIRQKRSVRLELLGRQFTVRSDDDEAYIAELVEFVNKKLHDIGRATGRVETDQIALLAVLDLADNLFRERQKSEAARRGLRERCRALLGQIDALSEMIREKAPREAATAEVAVRAKGAGSRQV